ncbi:hypothetical protein BJ166DRAFT_577348 [Pestalotiopsis sp. NC0098]|nr:hypothetical protein BJ166DRAFT_577348 [Pestalotiopsis sp. NC0098]
MSVSVAPDSSMKFGSLVLVTGANGFIGSHVADELLERGYNVRGSVRDTRKQAWLQEHFESKYGPGRFELECLPEMTERDAFDAGMKGVDGVVHVASPTTWSADTDLVIKTAVSGALNALKAANEEPSVKRFVLTSSSVAATFPSTDQPGVILGPESWNEEAVDLAANGPSNPVQQSWAAYAASKTLAEKAVWEFSRTNVCRSDLVVNTVLPSTNFGESLDPVYQGRPSTSSFVQSLWNGTHAGRLSHISPQYFIDVRDTARLHVAGLVLPGVERERIYAWAEPWNFDQVLQILRKQHPQKEFTTTASFQGGWDSSIVAKPRERALELLRRLGSDDFTSLEESVRLNTKDLS